MPMYGSEEMYRYMQPRGGGYSPEYAGISQTLNQANRASDRNRHDIERLGDDYAAHQRDMGDKLARLPGQAIDAYRDQRKFATEEERAQYDGKFAEQKLKGNEYTLAGQKREMEAGQREDAFTLGKDPTTGLTREDTSRARHYDEEGKQMGFAEEQRGENRKGFTRAQESHDAQLKQIRASIAHANAAIAQGNQTVAFQKLDFATKGIAALPDGPAKEQAIKDLNANYGTAFGKGSSSVVAGAIGSAQQQQGMMNQLAMQNNPMYQRSQQQIGDLDANITSLGQLANELNTYKSNKSIPGSENAVADKAFGNFLAVGAPLGMREPVESYDWKRPTQMAEHRMEAALHDKIAEVRRDVNRITTQNPQMAQTPQVQNMMKVLDQVEQQIQQGGGQGKARNGSLLIHGGGLPQMSQQNGTFLTGGQQGVGAPGQQISLPGYNMQASAASMRQTAPQRYNQQQQPQGNPAATWNAPNPQNYRSDTLKVNFQGRQPGAR